jgi:hypothetical protein
VVGELDHRVGLVVLEPDVIAGLVAFYQVCLEQQGLSLGIGDREIDRRGAIGHAGDPVAAGIGVGTNPVPEIDRLPDVDHDVVLGGARRVFEELVDARLAR